MTAYLKVWQKQNNANPINHRAVVGIILNEKKVNGKTITAQQARELCPTWADYSAYKARYAKQAENTAPFDIDVLNTHYAKLGFKLTKI